MCPRKSAKELREINSAGTQVASMALPNMDVAQSVTAVKHWPLKIPLLDVHVIYVEVDNHIGRFCQFN